ncbi:MAG: Nif3-like dinuclear metal center hexameric protein [Vicingaceae bacterium]
MKISEVIQQLEKLAPLSLQESYDNAGLIVGDRSAIAKHPIICLDSTEAVVDEAIAAGSNLIIAHHPIVFSGLKSITGKNYIEKTILKAIKNDIAIYAIHTNLDNVKAGVNRMIAKRIGLKDLKILSPKREILTKLVFFCPTADAEKVRNAVFEAGAGKIGEYGSCSFNTKGEGTFRAGENTHPHVGEKGQLHFEAETRVETIVPNNILGKVIQAMIEVHPYEEVAYDLYALKNAWTEVGSGMIGQLEQPMEAEKFLDHLKSVLNTEVVRHTKIVNKKVSRIAICGGSGSFLLENAIAQKANVFVTADFKYHQFFDANEKLVIADVGHFESEQFTMLLIQEYLQKKIPNFATYLSKVNTNPINYR